MQAALLIPAGGGTAGSVSDGETLSMRLGLRAERTFGSTSMLYGQIDYFHGFDDENIGQLWREYRFDRAGEKTISHSHSVGKWMLRPILHCLARCPRKTD